MCSLLKERSCVLSLIIYLLKYCCMFLHVKCQKRESLFTWFAPTPTNFSCFRRGYILTGYALLDLRLETHLLAITVTLISIYLAWVTRQIRVYLWDLSRPHLPTHARWLFQCVLVAWRGLNLTSNSNWSIRGQGERDDRNEGRSNLSCITVDDTDRYITYYLWEVRW